MFPFFHGRVKDFAFLIGVEESHHSSFIQYIKKFTPSIDDSSMPMEQYDAIEHEYRALLFQYRIAIERQMPTETVKMLKKRIDNAMAVRNRVT